jgi:hypothetical protein
MSSKILNFRPSRPCHERVDEWVWHWLCGFGIKKLLIFMSTNNYTFITGWSAPINRRSVQSVEKEKGNEVLYETTKSLSQNYSRFEIKREVKQYITLYDCKLLINRQEKQGNIKIHLHFEWNLDPRLRRAHGPQNIFIDLPTVKSNKTENQRNIYFTHSTREL